MKNTLFHVYFIKYLLLHILSWRESNNICGTNVQVFYAGQNDIESIHHKRIFGYILKQIDMKRKG